METDRIYLLHTLEKQGRLEPKEAAELARLLEANPENRETYSELNFIWDAAEKLPQPNTDASWQALQQKIKSTSLGTSGATRTIQPWMRYGIAASILITLGFFFYPLLMPSTANYSTAQGEMKELELPDGTHVTLNQSSNLAYAETNGQRIVRFEGEAYFAVAKDAEHPFVIQAPHTQTRVLGTAFRLFDRSTRKEAFLTVNEGKVSFSSDNKQLILVAGEKAILDSGSFEKEPSAAPFDPLQWEKGNLVFENERLSEVFARLELRYQTQIKFDNPAILRCRFSGTFKTESFKEICAIIAKTLNLELKWEKDAASFQGEACNHE